VQQDALTTRVEQAILCFVEVGRVVCVNYGPEAGKLCVIVDIVNQNFALVDGGNAEGGIGRVQLNFKHMALTPIKVEVERSAKSKAVAAAIEAADVATQWAASGWGKKYARQAKRQSATDFDRFNTMLLRKKRSQIIGRELAKLKKSA